MAYKITEVPDVDPQKPSGCVTAIVVIISIIVAIIYFVKS